MGVAVTQAPRYSPPKLFVTRSSAWATKTAVTGALVTEGDYSGIQMKTKWSFIREKDVYWSDVSPKVWNIRFPSHCAKGTLWKVVELSLVLVVVFSKGTFFQDIYMVCKNVGIWFFCCFLTPFWGTSVSCEENNAFLAFTFLNSLIKSC